MNKTKFLKKDEGKRSMAKMVDVSRPKIPNHNDPLQKMFEKSTERKKIFNDYLEGNQQNSDTFVQSEKSYDQM
jgi:hypothetical protein